MLVNSLKLVSFVSAVLVGLLLSSAAWADCQLRYCDNGDGTVTDTRSGLVWLKDASCDKLGRNDSATAGFSDANKRVAKLADGKCGLSDGSKPGDWRLPTRAEWQAMVDNDYFKPALSNAAGDARWVDGDVFDDVKSEGYWSSEAESNDTYAYGIGLFAGRVMSAGAHNQGYIWPLRSAK